MEPCSKPSSDILVENPKKTLAIPKLKDAKYAGTDRSESCTLILTYGCHAEVFAMSGLSLASQEDYYGVLRFGEKFPDVSGAITQLLQKNEAIQNIINILGLQYGKDYTNVKDLRYGHLMIITDPYLDGLHFKGLFINFLYRFWPSLLKLPNFLLHFLPPIVKAIDKKNTADVFLFYTMPEYKAWKKNLGNKATDYEFKSLKGLACSGTGEVSENFAHLNNYTQNFVWADADDGYAIELAFSNTKLLERRDWLLSHQAVTCIHSKEKQIRYRDFINKDLFLFFMADLQRSIPSMVDGLTLYQRKILFCAFKLPIIQETELDRITSYVIGHTAYFHDEASVVHNIIGMNQSYVGSNNINLLQPKGKFGTRLMGGKDHASYILSQLSPITRMIFHKADERFLVYLNDAGRSIEPRWFFPIIPMVLVNGSESTRWSSFIPNYNPRDVIANIKRLLDGEAMVPMHPWYKGFKGTIKKNRTSSSKHTGYTTTGIMKKYNNGLHITELPLRKWTQDYKEFLENTPFIESYKDHSDDKNVFFEIVMTEDQMKKTDDDLLRDFELTTTLSTAEMYLLDANGILKKYDTPEQILEEFFGTRLKIYEKRRKAQLCELEKAILLLENKLRYIDLVSKDQINPFNESTKLWADLKERAFNTDTEVVAAGEEKPQENARKRFSGTEYDYLLSMTLLEYTYESIQKLRQEKDEKKKERSVLNESTAKSLWLRELDALDKQLHLDGIFSSAESSR